jgi:hypothetical protein
MGNIPPSDTSKNEKKKNVITRSALPTAQDLCSGNRMGIDWTCNKDGDMRCLYICGGKNFTNDNREEVEEEEEEEEEEDYDDDDDEYGF